MFDARRGLRSFLDRFDEWWWGSPPRAEAGNPTIFWGQGPSFVERLRDRLSWIPPLRWEFSLPTVLAFYALAIGAIAVPIPSFRLAVACVWAAVVLLIGQSAVWLIRHQQSHPIARAVIFIVVCIASVPVTRGFLAWVDRGERQYDSDHAKPTAPASQLRPQPPKAPARNLVTSAPTALGAANPTSVPHGTRTPSLIGGKTGSGVAQSNPATEVPAPQTTSVADELVANARPYPEPYVPPTTAFTGLTNVALRNRVINTCARLRALEKGFNEDSKKIAASGPNAGADQFTAVQKQLDDRRDAEIKQFQRDFIPEIRALHFEMLNRLKLGPPQRYNRAYSAEAASALDSGELMGLHPAGDLCDYLENLAARL
jgi:hypothetical protein